VLTDGEGANALRKNHDVPQDEARVSQHVGYILGINSTPNSTSSTARRERATAVHVMIVGQALDCTPQLLTSATLAFRVFMLALSLVDVLGAQLAKRLGDRLLRWLDGESVSSSFLKPRVILSLTVRASSAPCVVAGV
jgi:hypothetical protein